MVTVHVARVRSINNTSFRGDAMAQVSQLPFERTLGLAFIRVPF